MLLTLKLNEQVESINNKSRKPIHAPLVIL